jgi:hypothetical protein
MRFEKARTRPVAVPSAPGPVNGTRVNGSTPTPKKVAPSA